MRDPPLLAQPGPVHVTVLGRNPRPRPGIRIHRIGGIHADEVGTLDGVPLTSPARTIIDLAATRPAADLEQLVAEAYARKLTTSSEVAGLLARHPGRPGVPALRALLEAGKPAFTHSVAERRLLSLIRKAELPLPRVNVWLHGYKVDFLWPEQLLVVEVDGHAFHASRPSANGTAAATRT
ncbi:MAG: hypothetical protein ACRDK9_09215 [Solirubrobacterales bacterium]